MITRLTQASDPASTVHTLRSVSAVKRPVRSRKSLAAIIPDCDKAKQSLSRLKRSITSSTRHTRMKPDNCVATLPDSNLSTVRLETPACAAS